MRDQDDSSQNDSQNDSQDSTGNDHEDGRSRGEGRASSCGSRRSRHSHHGFRSHRGRRKERVLHTRISEQLSEDIRRLADDLRVPASNLVRNVLEEVFTAVENVSGDVGSFFDDLVDEAEGVRERIRNQQEAAGGHRRDGRRGQHRRSSRSTNAENVEEELRRDEASEAGDSQARGPRAAGPDDSSNILGWQPIVLNQAVECASCSSRLDPGGNAFMAISQGGGLGKVVCRRCTQS